MEEKEIQQLETLFAAVPGGMANIVFDDMLTILFATDTFYSLIKSVSEKSVSKAPTALLKIVYSADIIYVNHQLAAQKSRKDNMLSLHFRTLQQDGSFKWVMITGNKTNQTHQSGSKVYPIYSCIAMDITDIMVKYKKLEQTNDYHRTITELSKDLYFEYEIATDTLSFSELFHEIFGKDSLITGFRSKLEKTKMIHEEERPAVVGIFNSMMSGKKQVRFEFRLITKEGNPVWYICYASIIFDEYRNPFKVVGKLSVKNFKSKEPEKPAYIPQYDSLTNVYTKESAEYLIAEAASNLEPDSLSALLLIDIRNYKNINEIRRSINGENILTTVGNILKTRFRSSDIIGRVGISEFVVYIKDIWSDKNVYDKAEQICDAIDLIYSYGHTKNGLSVSIGIALQRGEQEYQTLYTNANTALVLAKKTNGSSFEVFSGAII
ncbi:diguanylate cyclase [Lachnospiraceae bacterium MD1]|jgi:diguanylate cyclase (GGDEF)-like protein|uniref:Diguanylate cyclase n=1 Tax=Variimorphobacter saccharofermentans TaxID=2755051 RepID=A0A839JVX6_9FIRM|nr:diguanylate cyclase [Variimorphobacter saccharofermentans]MBB2181378.1 diguanylate cyclase [Variimorphobacter saccharofermentans]